jgi:hypothetical protein
MVAQPDIMQPLKDYDTADLDVFFGLPVFDNSWSTIFSVEEYFAAFEYASGKLDASPKTGIMFLLALVQARLRPLVPTPKRQP